MTNKEYLKKEKHIWEEFVPPRGQAKYVQGELLRALAKLQDEAQRNGNINWDDGFKVLANYLLTTIEESKILDEDKLIEFKDDISTLLDYESPYTKDDLYTRIAHIVVDFYIEFPELILHENNNKLHR